MTVSIQQKRGFYYAVLKFKRDERWHSKWVTLKLPIKGNKRNAEKLLPAILEKYSYLELDNDVPVIVQAFVEAILIWLNNKKIAVDFGTYEGYENTVKKHIVPYFKNMNLSVSEINATHIQDYYTYKLETGRLDGRKGGISQTSLIQHHTVFSMFFNSMKNKIDRNPMDDVVRPVKNEYQAEFYNQREFAEYLNLIKKEELYPIVFFAGYYGMRRSEVLGLKWSAVDFDERTIRITHTVTKNKTILYKDKTKNQSSKRTYPLLDNARELLIELKRKKEENVVAFGVSYHHSDYIFTWPDGKLFRPDYITERHRNLLHNHRLRHIRFHDLRHSCASILIALGYTLLDVKEWLGHSDIKMTADVYGHLELIRKKEMGDKFSKQIKAQEESNLSNAS